MIELKRALDEVARQLRVYGKSVLSGGPGDGNGRFWQNDAQAKEFGGLVLKVVREKAMDTSTNVTGGSLVGEELKRILIEKLGKYGKFRRNVTIVQMGQARARVPKAESDLTIYCPGEGRSP